MKLAGNTIFITGGGSGIGRADAGEIMVARAKSLRDQAGPNESPFVNPFNERFEVQPPEAATAPEPASGS